MSSPLANDLDHIIDHTRDLWEEIRGERIFVTGGTGFFGCWLLDSFLWANERLNLRSQATVLTRSPAAFRAKRPDLVEAGQINLLAGDVRNFVFPDGTFSQVIHAATDASAKLNAESPLLMLDTIVDGTRHVLDFASQCGAKNLLLTSSGAVYGKQPGDLTHVPEEYEGAPDPLDPRSAYGQGKRQAEHLCAQYGLAGGLQPKIARCFAFVGPRLPLDIHFAIGNFIRDGLKGGPIIIRSDGTAQRSYLYAADLAIWLWTILVRGQSLRPYNVGSEEALSIAEVAQRVAEQFPAKIAIEVHGTPNPARRPERYIPDTKRAKQELGLQAFVPLKTAILKTIQFERGKYAPST